MPCHELCVVIARRENSVPHNTRSAVSSTFASIGNAVTVATAFHMTTFPLLYAQLDSCVLANGVSVVLS